MAHKKPVLLGAAFSASVSRWNCCSRGRVLHRQNVRLPRTAQNRARCRQRKGDRSSKSKSAVRYPHQILALYRRWSRNNSGSSKYLDATCLKMRLTNRRSRHRPPFRPLRGRGRAVVGASDLNVGRPLIVTKHAALSEPGHQTNYDEAPEEKLRHARTVTGWSALIYAIMAVVPAIFYGLRFNRWITLASALCIVCCILHVLMYRRYSVRLQKLAPVGDAPNHLSDPDPPSGTSSAGQHPRHR